MKLIIGGDVSPSGPLNELIERGYYNEILGELKSIFKSADYSIVNFETTIADYDDKPIIKVGPNLKTTACLFEMLKWGGVNVVTMANNHVGDYGPVVIDKAFKILISNGIKYVGAGNNKHDASMPLYLEKNGKTVAIINCCEHEFGIASDNEAGSNSLDPIRQYYEISEAKKKADYVIVIVHGGHEHFDLPSIRMQDTYRFFIDCGADAVINGHQHCVSGFEIYNDKPIYYGTGNLLFNPLSKDVSSRWYEGMLIELNLNNDKISHRYIPYTQCKGNLSISIIKDTESFDNRIKKLSGIIVSRPELAKAVNEYYNKSSKSIKGRLQPWNGRILQGLFVRGFLPAIIGKRSLRKLQNLVFCESHQDKLKFYLSNIPKT